jgi:hypothetical protein
MSSISTTRGKRSRRLCNHYSLFSGLTRPTHILVKAAATCRSLLQAEKHITLLTATTSLLYDIVPGLPISKRDCKHAVAGPLPHFSRSSIAPHASFTTASRNLPQIDVFKRRYVLWQGAAQVRVLTVPVI